jgi:hypothetical protein
MRAALLVFSSMMALTLACDAPKAPTTTTTATATTAAPTAPTTTTTAPAERAALAAKTLQEKLKTALLAAMQDKGPVGAIEVCATVAPALAKELSTGGLTVGRTGVRLRNPDNQAPTWLTATMGRWEGEAVADRKPWNATLDDGRFVFAAPLSMLPLCATCHGTDVAADVKAAIAARYPQDAATGFAEGALRGAVWVELAAVKP